MQVVPSATHTAICSIPAPVTPRLSGSRQSPTSLLIARWLGSSAVAWLTWDTLQDLGHCRITTRPSRRRFGVRSMPPFAGYDRLRTARRPARLNSGVRPLKSEAAWSRFNLGVPGSAYYPKLRQGRSRAVESVAGCPSFGQAKRPIGRASLGEGAASASSRLDTHVAARPIRLASATSQAEALRASHCRRMLRPNQSFKPTPLRGAA